MQRGSIMTVLLVVILVASVAIGVFLIKYTHTDTTSEAAAPSNNLLLPSSPRPNNQVISSKLTGLQFEVPKGFTVKHESEEQYFKRANGNIRKNFNYYILYYPPEFEEAFYVMREGEGDLNDAILTGWVFQNPENLGPEAFYSKYWYYPFVWGDFSASKNNIAPKSIELIGGKEGSFGVVDYRPGKPKFIYIPLPDKNLMIQLHLPTEGNLEGQEILRSITFQ